MGNLHKVLIVALAHFTFLFPQWVLPDNDCSYPFLDQEVYNALASSMQVVVNTPIAFVGDPFHLLSDTFSILFGKLLFEFFDALVVPLVPRLYRTTVNQSGHKALTV